MPVQANILANMQQLSLPDIYQAAETTKYMRVRNELLGYQADEESEIAKRREKRREIEAMYAAMPERIAQYEKMGMHQEAQEAKEALLAGHRQEVSMFEIIGASLDALPPEERSSAWLQMREQALRAGMFEPHQMPDRYEDGGQDWIDTWLKKVKGKLEKMEITYGEPPSEQYPAGRTMTEERIQQGGEFIEEEFEPYEAASDVTARTGGGRGGKPWQMTAGDSNSIRNHAAMIFGGNFNPTTQKFQGIAGKELLVSQLAERAAEIYNQGQGQIPHDKAVAQAAREQGQDVESTSNNLINDPANIRR